MNIYVTDGIGSGRTEKSAFDAALFSAGVANYNILELSSVIPDKSKIVIGKIDRNAVGEHGYKLYAVLASQTAKNVGEEAWAGIGWVVDGKTGGGLFVEHHGHSREEVDKLIVHSLEDMVKYRVTHDFGSIQKRIAGIECKEEGLPACALVCAYYQSESWEKKSQ